MRVSTQNNNDDNVTILWKLSAKHSGRYFEFSVSGNNSFSYPYTIVARRWCDMDDLNNHSESCARMLPEDDPEYSDDCNCESFVECEKSMKIESSPTDVRADIFIKKVSKFFAKAID